MCSFTHSKINKKKIKKNNEKNVEFFKNFSFIYTFRSNIQRDRFSFARGDRFLRVRTDHRKMFPLELHRC
jgi:hypothetical protein